MKTQVSSRAGRRASCAPAPVAEALEDRRLLAVTGGTTRPSVSWTNPAAGTTDLNRGADIVAYVSLPNMGGVTDDPAVLAANVRLYKSGSRVPVPASVNTTGGGDAIILTPMSPLAANTKYTYEITAGLTDETKAAFKPHRMSLTTGNKGGQSGNVRVEFEKVRLTAAEDRRFTGVTIGPDRRLYAGTMDGEILRFDVLGDGKLGSATVINTVRDNHGGGKRILTGLRFDPASTASDLALWVSHGDGAEHDAPDWSGAISRLSGPDLREYRACVVGLPRSVRDHLTQQMDFGPGGALYVSQGSNNAMGGPDNAWGRRAERLLSAAILRVDTAALLGRSGPLDVKTEDGGTYDPFAAGAAVTIYATGVRNAFDLLWHSNGHLYAPNNGSAPGGNTPGGNGVPGITNVSQNEPDRLFKIRPGRYYGHPNPTRNEFVLNGGNPSAAKDPEEIPDYPVGVMPDPEWDPAILEFGDNRSPNGVIEYKSDAFDGALKGSLIVCEFSGGNDLVVLRPDAAGDTPEANLSRGMVGTTGLVDPLDLVEHVGTGNLYVVEYGARRITLLRPRPPVDPPRAVFNDPVGGTAGWARKLTLRNPTNGELTVDDVVVLGADADMFRIVGTPAVPATLAAGAGLEVTVEFAPPADAAVGIKTATLRALTGDPARPHLDLALRGLATAGETGANEPSLQRVLDLYELRIDAGDADPTTSEMPLPLAPGNDAVDVAKLVKAGDGPVTVEPLAVFAAEATPTIRFGYYDPADGVRTEVLGITEAQRVRPSLTGGETSFDPGTGVFGLYASAPAYDTRTAYTEDFRNTFEPDPANRRKALFFPMRNADGTVPNAFVVAFEEVAGRPDFQDFVAVIRNVRNAADPPAPQLAVLDNGTPLQSGASVEFGEVSRGEPRRERTFTLRNSGNAELTFGAVTLPEGFELIAGPALALAPGATTTLTIALSTSEPGAFAGQVVLPSNDPAQAAFSLNVSGTVVAPPTPRPAAAITIARFSGGLPESVLAGGKAARGVLEVHLRNSQGVPWKGPVTVSASFSGIDDGVAITNTTRTLKFKPGETKKAYLKLSVASTMPEGEHTLLVSVAAGDDTETTGAGTVTVRRPHVRLVGKPEPVELGFLSYGRRTTLPVWLRNEGTAPTPKTPMTFHIVVSGTKEGAAPIHQTTTTARVKLKPGAARHQPLEVVLPPVFPAGSYFLLVRFDNEVVATLSFRIA